MIEEIAHNNLTRQPHQERASSSSQGTTGKLASTDYISKIKALRTDVDTLYAELTVAVDRLKSIATVSYE